MGLDATARRRWFGAIVVVLALAMLVLGETTLKGTLGGVAFLFYWLVCFVLIILAIGVAFRDVRAIQDEVRTEQRTLLESTLKDIENEARSKQKRAKKNGGKG
jgi:hypothetical protein